ncbi:MAG: DivIVA domain-containing protein [Gemmatimonadaceae bacterium]
MDETFHLTPLDVRRYDFGKAIRGYNPERVEQFRDQVAEELERLTRQSQDLEQKAKGFHEQLRAFRERDKALNDALVSAQQLRSEIRESSEREAALIVREARTEAEREIEGARNEIRKLEAHLTELDRARRNHLAQVRVIVERHLAEITSAETAPGPQLPVMPRVSSVAALMGDEQSRAAVGSAERE